jgi:hypothetical protein
VVILFFVVLRWLETEADRGCTTVISMNKAIAGFPDVNVEAYGGATCSVADSLLLFNHRGGGGAGR